MPELVRRNLIFLEVFFIAAVVISRKTQKAVMTWDLRGKWNNKISLETVLYFYVSLPRKLFHIRQERDIPLFRSQRKTQHSKMQFSLLPVTFILWRFFTYISVSSTRESSRFSFLSAYPTSSFKLEWKYVHHISVEKVSHNWVYSRSKGCAISSWKKNAFNVQMPIETIF